MTSRFLCNGAPTQCASCGEAFVAHAGRLEAWRFGAHYFCGGCAERFGRRAPQATKPVQQPAAIMSLSVAIAIPGYSRLGSGSRTAPLEPSRRYP
jgi:hypothetical protein